VKRIQDSNETERALTLLFNLDGSKNVGIRLWTEAMTSQSSWAEQVVKIVDCVRVLYSYLYATLVFALEL